MDKTAGHSFYYIRDDFGCSSIEKTSLLSRRLGDSLRGDYALRRASDIENPPLESILTLSGWQARGASTAYVILMALRILELLTSHIERRF
jgi:hypothetical protein